MAAKFQLVLRYLIALIFFLIGIFAVLIPILPGWLFLGAAITLAFPIQGKYIMERLKNAKGAFINSYKKGINDKESRSSNIESTVNSENANTQD